MKRRMLKMIPCVMLLFVILSVAVFADEEFPVTVNSLELNSAHDKVTLNCTADSDFLSEHDGVELYLMELKAWNGSVIPPTAKPVGKAKLNGADVSFDCGYEVSTDRYDEFLIAIKDGAGYSAVSRPHFLGDPAVLAQDISAYPDFTSKKGLASVDTGLVLASGSSQTVVDIAVEDYLLPTYSPASTSFVYGGNTYYADTAALNALDLRVRALSDSRVNIFARVYLSGKYLASDTKLAALYYSEAAAGASAYALNTSSESAVAYYTAFIDFLADRYGLPSGDNGFVANWIAGMATDDADRAARGDISADDFVESYQRVLRLTDIAARSKWANARVYVPISNKWNGAAKTFLTALEANAKSHGDFPWRVACDAYASDPANASIWNDEQAVDSEDAPFITMKNIGVLCDFLASEAMKYEGEPRNVAVVGFAVNSAPDQPADMTPAASFVYAYLKAAFNDRIDALVWSTDRDAAQPAPPADPAVTSGSGETSDADAENDPADKSGSGDPAAASGSDDAALSGSADADAPKPASAVYFGLYSADGTRKIIYDTFAKIDARLVSDQSYKSGDSVFFATSIFNISDLTTIAPNYTAQALEKRTLSENIPILASDIPSRAKRTSTLNFAGGIGSFYAIGTDYVELRTVPDESGDPTAALYAGLPANGGSKFAGAVCPMFGTPAADVKFISLDVFVEAPTDVASVSVTVILDGASGAQAQFVGSATVKPNSWQKVAFRCDDVASSAETLGTLSLLVSSYDGADHEGSWGVAFDNIITYGASSSTFGSFIVKLLVAVIVIAVLFFIIVLIIRFRNKRKKSKKAARNDRPAPANSNPQP